MPGLFGVPQALSAGIQAGYNNATEAMAYPQAQAPSKADAFWEAYNAAMPGVTAGLDMASRLGMLEGPVMGNRPVPHGAPNIGPGFSGIAELIRASLRGGY